MATIDMMTVTTEELQRALNQTIEQVAYRMVQDGLIEKPEQITDRYLALVLRKGKIAKMFEGMFYKDDSDETIKLNVIRVDNTPKV